MYEVVLWCNCLDDVHLFGMYRLKLFNVHARYPWIVNINLILLKAEQVLTVCFY